jgi:hypothetical protein
VTPIYVFICTKTTAATVVPARYNDQNEFNRKVKGAFVANQSGHLQAGRLAFFSVPDAVPNHLLCDGSILDRVSFPQLFEHLRDTFGGDGVDTFAIPDYRGDIFAMPSDTPAQSVSDGGTVSTGGTVSSGATGGTTGGNVVSGGKPVPLADNTDINPQ